MYYKTKIYSQVSILVLSLSCLVWWIIVRKGYIEPEIFSLENIPYVLFLISSILASVKIFKLKIEQKK